ncbi:MAG: hypothetical protein MJZ10_10015, partial [Fibrobacter sp.]|nr:hypothetical protein [Fibrobacter sp.]
ALTIEWIVNSEVPQRGTRYEVRGASIILYTLNYKLFISDPPPQHITHHSSLTAHHSSLLSEPPPPVADSIKMRLGRSPKVKFDGLVTFLRYFCIFFFIKLIKTAQYELFFGMLKFLNKEESYEDEESDAGNYVCLCNCIRC